MRPPHAPLYDASFEHDACGVGFVADSRGREPARVLPLALAGLGALRHRGAFAADGASSDGAGISLPLEHDLRATLGVEPDDGIVVAFLPRDAGLAGSARGIVEEAFAREGLMPGRWRSVPTDESALGGEARESAPRIEQLPVQPGRSRARSEFERDLTIARRRAESSARAAALIDFAIASASCRTIVYKGLVAGDRLAAFYADLARPMRVSYAVFHQRYATNTHPRWDLAQPFRLIAHNGEINTVRANREQLRGRAGKLAGRPRNRNAAIAPRLTAAGPLLSPNASDSLSLDEALEILTLGGRSLPEALLAAIPEALALRSEPQDEMLAFQRMTAGVLAPWDGPAAIVFADGRRVGALMDRNGLRPAAYTITRGGLVAMASEAGAVPIAASETELRGRLGPGEMLLVEPGAGRVALDAEAKRLALRRAVRVRAEAAPFHRDVARSPEGRRTDERRRWIAGLDAERLRLSIRTMALEAQEPLWSMGDDTPTPASSLMNRPVTDHLRQSFAQVTNPAIDPERERIVMELATNVGRRSRLLDRPRGPAISLRLRSPVVGDLHGLLAALALRRGNGAIARLEAAWPASAGRTGLGEAVALLARDALTAANRGAELVVLSDDSFDSDRLPIPSALGVGAVHAALTDAGLRGETDIAVSAADILDVHALAVTIAAGATVVHPWLALELAAEIAGGRGTEHVDMAATCANLVLALEKGLRKVLARMGISCVASYTGGQLFDALELSPEVLARCFPAAPSWPGTVGFAELADRQLARLAQSHDIAPDERLPDTGFARYRGDGERHLFAPPIVKAIQALLVPASESNEARLDTYRAALARTPATVRDQLALRRAPAPLPLDDVEPARSIARRFVGAAMSLGALSPEAHQAITLGLRQIGASSNSGEGGEDPAWYTPDSNGRRRDSAIKQVASARFGVTAEYLARAEQLEIKIAQGSKPGEGGQLPGRKVTPLIASLRRGQPGQSMISPPPHHDIYSIEDLAQLIADLRAINPGARIGVKLVASLGVGTIAAGVAKAGADYVQVSGHAGGTGASPLSSIKHVGIPWELGVAETHQVLLRNGLRDRVALRTDGGLQTGRDVVIAALLGAEEFGFGTATLIAIGCDMARQCHLDTCPTGVATQREDLRRKFSGTPDDVARFFLAIADDVRRELADLGVATVGEIVGRADLLTLAPHGASTLELQRVLDAPAWSASAARRASASSSRATVSRDPASVVESTLAGELVHLPSIRTDPDTHIDHADREGAGAPVDVPVARITTAERAFGAHVTGMIERGVVRRPVRWQIEGAAGQSFGAFASESVELVLEGQANDYVGKGLSGGRLILRPEPELLPAAARHAIAGNTCLYGATAGRVHVIGRGGMRFAVRNSGAEAVVEGIGPHGCEYMTGGTVVILGSAGRNLCAGMTGGRVFLYDAAGTGAAVESLDRQSASATRMDAVVATREDGHALLHLLHELLDDHARAGSVVAADLVASPARIAETMWLVEPVGTAESKAAEVPTVHATAAGRVPAAP